MGYVDEKLYSIHADLQGKKWSNLSFYEQMANVGAEVGRAIKWKEKTQPVLCFKATSRALELLSFTIRDEKNLSGIKELTRTYELLVDLLIGENEYKTNSDSINRYFLAFNAAARKRK